jgi:hypothetical protein
MNPHPVLTEHPTYVEHRAKIDRLEAVKASWRSEVSRERQAYDQAVKDHKEASRLALMAGEPQPPEPAPPADTGEKARTFHDEQKRLREQGRVLIADLCEQLEADAETRLSTLTAEASPHVSALAEIAREVDSLVSTIRETRMLKERRRDHIAPFHGVSDRMRRSVTVVDLTAAVAENVNLLDPVTPVQKPAPSTEPEPRPNEHTRHGRGGRRW